MKWSAVSGSFYSGNLGIWRHVHPAGLRAFHRQAARPDDSAMRRCEVEDPAACAECSGTAEGQACVRTCEGEAFGYPRGGLVYAVPCRAVICTAAPELIRPASSREAPRAISKAPPDRIRLRLLARIGRAHASGTLHVFAARVRRFVH
jgi:hypothetical protein